MAVQGCYGSETVTDLFSEINPAYVTLVHSSLRKLAGLNFSFTKVAHASWQDNFSKMPSAQSKHFNQSLFPSYLRKVKNLAQLVDPKLLPELPAKPLPTPPVVPTTKNAPNKAAVEKLNCSLSTFVELLATFIDSFFVALDCNLLANEALEDLSKLENAECHIIAYCLYAARMWSNLPIQHVDCFNRSCLEVAKLLKMALDSPTMATFKMLTKTPKIPTISNNQTANLARLFVAAFEGLVTTVIDLKSKQNHLLKLGKLRESYLTVATNCNYNAGINKDGDPFDGLCDGDGENRQNNGTGRKFSLPSALLRTLGLDDKISSPASPQPTVPSIDFNAVHAMVASRDQRSSRRNSSGSVSLPTTNTTMVQNSSSRRVSIAENCEVIDNVFDQSEGHESLADAFRKECIIKRPSVIREVSGANVNNNSNREDGDDELSEAVKRLHSELLAETDSRLHLEQTVRTLEQHLAISASQLNACRAELGSEIAKHEALEREVETLNLQLRAHLEKVLEQHQQIGGDFDGLNYFVAGAANPVEELKARQEQLISWNESVLKKCQASQLRPQITLAGNGCSTGELQQELEDLKRGLEQSNEQEQQATGVVGHDVGIQVNVTNTYQRQGTFSRGRMVNNNNNNNGNKNGNRRYSDSSSGNASNNEMNHQQACRTIMCCPFGADDADGGGAGGANKCPVVTNPGTYVCVPVNMRYHSKKCTCPVCRKNNNINRKQSAGQHASHNS